MSSRSRNGVSTHPRGRVLTGNRRDLPPGLEPVEWAGQVFALMDQGHTEAEARRLVAEYHAEQSTKNEQEE